MVSRNSAARGGVIAGLLFAIAIVGAFIAKPVIAALAPGKVVATVNGDQITQADLDFVRTKIFNQPVDAPEAVVAHGRQIALDFIVTGKVGSLEAEVDGTASDPANIRAARLVSARVIGEGVFDAHAKVDEAVIRAKYDALVENLKGKRDFALDEMRFGSQAEAVKANNKAALLAAFKAWFYPGAQLMDLGYVQEEHLQPAMLAIIKNAKTGDLIGPVQLGNGWAVIYVRDSRDRRAPKFEAVHDILAMQARAQARQKIVDDLKKKWHFVMVNSSLIGQ